MSTCMDTLCNNSMVFPAPCSIDRLCSSNMEIPPQSMLQPKTDWTDKMYLGKQTWRFFHHPC
eukprot:9944237-Karenia_brevis.AAC.1